MIEENILQTRLFNRLFFITQNALAFFAYPSINTKRYIHSLGTLHVASYMLKNAVVNSEQSTKKLFLKNLTHAVHAIIKEKKINIDINNKNIIDDNSLYDFVFPLESKKNTIVYMIVLQALRIAALLHDIGHLPFSHQAEYAMQKLYRQLMKKDFLNDKEKDFIKYYCKVTSNNTELLHEALGLKFIKLLFKKELDYTDPIIQLLYELVIAILKEKKHDNFDFSLLHSFVSSTIDADRLDYINRDMLASGYISGPLDFIEIAKSSVLFFDKQFALSFYDDKLMHLERVIEMRFNLYKKIIYNVSISQYDAHLENVILHLCKEYFQSSEEEEINQSIAMLWNFSKEPSLEKRLDILCQLDENWLMNIFKQEYFKTQRKKQKCLDDKLFIHSCEQILFGKKSLLPLWKDLSDLYNFLDFSQVQRYKFRESFGFISKNNLEKLQEKFQEFSYKYSNDNFLILYRIVSLNSGIDKNFSLYDGKKLIKIDEVSTIRKRIKKSILNTVPFYIYTNDSTIDKTMKNEIKEILISTFL